MKTAARFFIALWLCLSPDPAVSALREVREVHYQMGTFLEITLWHPEPDTARRMIREAIQEVHRLEQILSNFDPDSSVSQLNRRAGKARTPVAPELCELLRMAQHFSVETAGDFDVTVGPLMELWRESSAHGRLPDRNTLASALALVGHEKLKVYDTGDAELLKAGMQIDLGGIGKGYALDRITGRFKAAGIRSALINFGGSSIFALGAPPEKPGWEIGIQDAEGRLRGMIHLRDKALSTSGSMGKFWTIGGKNFGHLIDPKSGMPVSEPRMATAVAANATLAEALTKPLILRGKDSLRLLTRFPAAEAVVISGKSPLIFSRGFKAQTNWQEIPSS